MIANDDTAQGNHIAVLRAVMGDDEMTVSHEVVLYRLSLAVGADLF
jgi:hypothetical protein